MPFLEKITGLFKRLGNYIRELWYTFEDLVYANQKKTIIYSVISVLVVCLFTFLMLFANSAIRSSQISQLLNQSIPTEQVTLFPYNKGNQLIASKKAISVMFSKPQGAAYSETMKLVSEKEEELNRKFYYYPIVYQATDIGETYQLNPDEVTFIFFEEGKEKNRFTFDSLENAEENFIPELNRLPMWNLSDTKAEDSEQSE